MATFFKKYWTLFGLVIVLALVALSFTFVSPEEIVSYVGVKNTYLVSFLLAVFGGLSAVTGVSFFVSVASFASGGASPILLILAGGAGIFISDTIFFLVARYGVDVFKKDARPASLYLISKIEKLPPYLVLIIVFVYIGLTPLPNDILMIALALSGMRFKKLAPVLLFGSFSIVAMAVYLGEIIFG